MLKLKPVWITLLTVALFVGGMALGTTSDWWRTDGRKTPLDGDKFYETHEDEADASAPEAPLTEEEAHDTETETETHDAALISGETTIQQALDLGVPPEKLEELLGGDISDTNKAIKVAAQERGLQFGVIKDALNALLAP